MVNPIWIIAILLLSAFTMPLWALIHRRLPAFIPVLVSGFNLFVALSHFFKMSIMPLVVKTGGFRPPIAIHLVVDYFSLFSLILVNFVALLLALSYLSDSEHDYRFYMLFLLNLLGASGMILTGDLFNSFVFLEIFAISGYALAASKKEKHALEGGIKYLIIGSIGSSFYLLGVFLLYKLAGTLSMADIAAHFQRERNGLFYLAGAFMLTGLAVETKLFPLNMWAPDVYQGAYNKIASQFSSIISKASLYLMFRIVFLIFDDPLFYRLLMALGLITFVIAEFNALKQENLKRLLGYSSMGQMGLTVFAFALYGQVQHPEAFFAALLLALNHALAKALIFSNLDNFGEKLEIKDLQGIFTANPLQGLVFTIGALSILGFPFTPGFWAKIEVLGITLRTSQYLLFFLLILMFMVEAFYYFRLISHMWSGAGERYGLKALVTFSVVVLALLILYQGIYPVESFLWVNKAVTSFINKALYIGLIAGGL